MHRATALKERLPLSRSTLRAWKRIIPPKPEILLAHELLRAACNRMVAASEHECGHHRCHKLGRAS